MVRESIKKLSGRTLNTSLSPDQSIAHGAALYAGMLLSNRDYTRTIFSSEASSRLSKVRQQSVSARALGILIRDEASGERVPHYLIPANSPLPAAQTHVFGTVVERQVKVHVQIVESGAGDDAEYTILGHCNISDLPPELPEGSEIEVTISYDHQARVHVSARDLRSGRSAETEIIRQENLEQQLQSEPLPVRSDGSSPKVTRRNKELPAESASPAGAADKRLDPAKASSQSSTEPKPGMNESDEFTELLKALSKSLDSDEPEKSSGRRKT
jgi:molecular chaperone DnaK